MWYSQLLLQVAQILIVGKIIPASDVSQRVLQVADGGDLHQLRFELAKVPFAALGGVDAEGEDAKAIAESPALPDAINGVGEVLAHSIITDASVQQSAQQDLPCPFKACLRGCPRCTSQKAFESL